MSLHRKGDFIFPVELELKFDDGSTVHESWDGVDRWTRFTYVKKAELVSAEIDPQHRIWLDANFFNNSYVVANHGAASMKLSSYWVIAQELMAATKPGIFLGGLRLLLANKRTLLWSYLALVFVGAVGGASMHARIGPFLDHSLAAQKLAGSIDVAYYAELYMHANEHDTGSGPVTTALTLLSIILSFFFAAGIVYVFLSGEKPRLAGSRVFLEVLSTAAVCGDHRRADSWCAGMAAHGLSKVGGREICRGALRSSRRIDAGGGAAGRGASPHLVRSGRGVRRQARHGGRPAGAEEP